MCSAFSLALFKFP